MGQEAGRETIYFYFLHQREDRGGGKAPPGKEHACCLQKPTGPSFFLLLAAAGGARICFVKQGESKLVVCVQRREECFVPGWSIVYQTTFCPPHNSSSSLKQRNHVAQTHKEQFGNNLRCESSSQCRGLREKKEHKNPSELKWGDGVHVLRGSL